MYNQPTTLQQAIESVKSSSAFFASFAVNSATMFTFSSDVYGDIKPLLHNLEHFELDTDLSYSYSVGDLQFFNLYNLHDECYIIQTLKGES